MRQTREAMKARMNHPVMILPDARKALNDLHEAAKGGALPLKTIGLVELRASQINGCSVCVDMPDPVPDEIWEEATKHYDEKALAALLITIANINVWNRLNVAVRQVVGAWRG
jgi:alkylhydroperoxidase family enzyme